MKQEQIFIIESTAELMEHAKINAPKPSVRGWTLVFDNDYGSIHLQPSAPTNINVELADSITAEQVITTLIEEAGFRAHLT